MNLAEQAFTDLFPEKSLENYNLNVKYTAKFKPYNANVRYVKDKGFFHFNLSKKWKNVSKEIQIGIIQELILKIFKKGIRTINMDLYKNFMRSLHITIPKTNTDSILDESFKKINEEYFFGLIEKPNLVWHDSAYRLGCYEYGTDTISISKILVNYRDLLDYVMYHEALHKKYKFYSKNGRSCHHTKEFKKMEKKFKNAEEMENKLKNLQRI